MYVCMCVCVCVCVCVYVTYVHEYQLAQHYQFNDGQLTKKNN